MFRTNFPGALLMALGTLTLFQEGGVAYARDITTKDDYDFSPDLKGFSLATQQFFNNLEHDAFCFVSEEIFGINQYESCATVDELHPVVDLDSEMEDDPRQLASQAANHPALLPIPDYVLNDEVRAYQPQVSDIRYQYKKEPNELIIFKDTALNSKEQQIMAKFEAHLAKTGKQVPTTFRNDNEMLRFYLTNGNDFDKALDSMDDYIEFLYDFQIPLLEDAENQLPLLNKGFFYGYKRDKGQRPNFVLNLRKLMDMKVEVDEFLETADFLCAYTQYHALVPGQIETWNLIIDAKDISLSEFPVSSLFGIVQRLKRGYKQRMFNIVAINIHWLLKGAASIVFNFVPANVGEKILFFGKDYKPHLEKLIGKESLEKSFGGFLPNKTDDFFPPHYN